VFCALPPAPLALGGRDNNDTDLVVRGLLSSGDCSLVASTLHWLSALMLPWGGEGGGGREEACGIPGGGEEDEDRGREVNGGFGRGSMQAGGGGG